MFKPRDCVELGAGGAASAAVLSLDRIVPADGPDTGLRARLQRWHAAAGAALGRFERHFVHDLAEEIGSPRWFRAAGTLAVLSTVTLALWPDFSRLEAAPSMHVDRTVRDEFRSQMVMPLALGGDSGRRMGANPALVAPLAAAPERTSLHMVATFGQGDHFARMLQRAGVGSWDAARAAELVGAVTPLGEIKPGTRFEIALGRRGEGEVRPLERLDFQARFDTALTISRADGGLTVNRRAIAVDTTPLRIRGTVGAGLYRSARAAGAPPEAVQAYLQAIDQHYGLDSIGPGDGFDIVIEHKRSATGEEQSGKLLFAGLEQGGKPRVQLMRFGEKGELFDAVNPGGGSSLLMAQPTGGLMMPVAGQITSSFGLRRHPILGYTRMHAGVDFGATWGSPIVAVASGVVSYAGRRGGHGNYVRLDHGGGLGSGYGHMSRIAVAAGTSVRAGQVIGYVGSTGLSTGPHLHYEVYQAGRTVNPLGVSFAAVRMQAAPVDAKRMAEIKKRLEAIKGIKPLGSHAAAGMASKPGKLAYRD